MDQREFERQAWNEALASGDTQRIERTRNAILQRIAARTI